jgi:arylsulfatase A-like enzyme
MSIQRGLHSVLDGPSNAVISYPLHMTTAPDAPAVPAAPDRPRNVLFITADQFRGDFLSCAGTYGRPGGAVPSQVVRTPNLGALGVQGAYLPNSYAPVPVCVPSRYAFMTGRSPISFGMRGNASMPMPDGAATLPSVFAGAGYRTAAIGKMHFSP